jgi:hypothetical protein
MSSRTFSRSMVTALVVCALLVLAAPPVQAGQAAGLLGGLSAKLQTWAAAWWPAAVGTDSRGGIIDPNGRTQRRAAAPVPGGKGSNGANRHHGRDYHGPIRPECSNGVDPNGHCF